MKKRNSTINFLRKSIRKLKARGRRSKSKIKKANVRALVLKIKSLRPKLLKFNNKNSKNQRFESKKTTNITTIVIKGLGPKYYVNRNKLGGKVQKKSKRKSLRTKFRVTFSKEYIRGTKVLTTNYFSPKKDGFESYTHGLEKTTGCIERRFTRDRGLVKNPHISRGYINYRYITLNSKKNKAFAFRNVGVFLWSQRKKFFDKNIKSRFIFKKKLYSFLFPNEVRKAIMNRRKSFKSYRFIYNKSNFRKKKGYYSLVFFKANYKNFFRLTALAQALPLRNKPLSHN